MSAIVFGSDQGLVGQFNDVLADFVAKALDALPGEKKVWAVGERIHARLADAGLAPVGLFAVPTSVNAITPLVGQILVESEAHHGQGEIGQLYLFHNRPKSGAAYEPVSQHLLPLDEQWGLRLAHLPWPTKNLPEVIGGQEQTLSALVREYLFVSLYKACAESLASENASRLAAMQRAEKNIDELVGNLNQTFRRLRQTSIDEELFDVLSGYESLSKHRKVRHLRPQTRIHSGKSNHENQHAHAGTAPEDGRLLAGGQLSVRRPDLSVRQSAAEEPLKLAHVKHMLLGPLGHDARTELHLCRT